MLEEKIDRTQNTGGQKIVEGERTYTVFDGLLGKNVNLLNLPSNKIILPEQVVLEIDEDSKMNALKYRQPVKYLGKQYEQIVVPCTPAYELSIIKTKSLEGQRQQNSLLNFVKVPYKTQTLGLASGKRSAIYKDANGRLFRFKGCGNQDKGFIRQKNQSRGHHFYHTAKRQLYMTTKINQVFKQQLGINKPANKPLYAFNYTKQATEKVNVPNELPLISKYCCVFETQGDRRVGTHLISPLQILYLSLFDHAKVGWKQLLTKWDRFDNNEPVEFVFNFELFVSPGQKFLTNYDNSKQIQNYINFTQKEIKIIENYDGQLKKIVQKLVPKEYQQKALNLLRKIQKSQILSLIEILLRRVGFQIGRIKRVMCEKGINWGFYSDHTPQWHCNAHLNNFIVSNPLQSKQNSFFVLPLDYDLAFTEKQFICIEEDSESYGIQNPDIFQNYLCSQLAAMELSLFGLEVMNFKYGIDEAEVEMSRELLESRKMGKIVFRDCLVKSFHKGMRNTRQYIQEVDIKWQSKIESISNLIEACLYLSINFNT